MMLRSECLTVLTDTDHELFHYEIQTKIQMENFPEKAQIRKNPTGKSVVMGTTTLGAALSCGPECTFTVNLGVLLGSTLYIY